ncbi:Ferric uptake regulation protein [compost metagenome]
MEEFRDESIEQRQRQVAADNAFVLREHMLVLYGVCPQCRAGATEAEPTPELPARA